MDMIMKLLDHDCIIHSAWMRYDVQIREIDTRYHFTPHKD